MLNQENTGTSFPTDNTSLEQLLAVAKELTFTSPEEHEKEASFKGVDIQFDVKDEVVTWYITSQAEGTSLARTIARDSHLYDVLIQHFTDFEVGRLPSEVEYRRAYIPAVLLCDGSKAYLKANNENNGGAHNKALFLSKIMLPPSMDFTNETERP